MCFSYSLSDFTGTSSTQWQKKSCRATSVYGPMISAPTHSSPHDSLLLTLFIHLQVALLVQSRIQFIQEKKEKESKEICTEIHSEWNIVRTIRYKQSESIKY